MHCWQQFTPANTFQENNPPFDRPEHSSVCSAKSLPIHTSSYPMFSSVLTYLQKTGKVLPPSSSSSSAIPIIHFSSRCFVKPVWRFTTPWTVATRFHMHWKVVRLPGHDREAMQWILHPIQEPSVQHIAVRNSSSREGSGILSCFYTDSPRPPL